MGQAVRLMAADMTALTQAIIAAAPTICDEAAHLREADIAAAAPIDTGALSQSGTVDTQGTADGAVSTLKFTEEYAGFLDEGTGPHEIAGNPLLAFEWGGQTVIVHSVQHPGSTKHKGWFTDRATDDSLWGLAVQQVLSGTAIV
jgi:hypothetical protein